MKYYVYEHYLDRKLFYIGKGCNNRAYDLNLRSTNWKNKVSGRENEVIVKIIAYFENEDDAYLFEKFKIKRYIEKKGSLENVVYNNKKKRNLKTVYNKTKDIKRIEEICNNTLNSVKISERINHVSQIRPHLKQFNKHKIIAFTRTIAGMKSIEKIAIEEGFKPLLLWSDANRKYELTEEQFVAKEKVIMTNKVPEPYNFLIINSSMKEDWNLKDKNIKLAIMNITNTTDFIHAREKIKTDIDMLIYRTNDKSAIDIIIEIPNKYMNTPLSVLDKDNLCEDLNIIDSKGRLTKWRTVAKTLEENRYILTNKRVRIAEKQLTFTTITK